jgi:SAM-dependent methyltransferase
LATDIWRQSISAEQTNAEISFLISRLKLSKGHKVLDVPCADGRLALPLARKGIAVTGVDLSTRCLAAAKTDAENAGKLPLAYEQSDMRSMSWREQFEAAFCMGNSFGYFDPKDTRKFLAGVAQALKPAGGFILDTCLAAETFFTVGGTKEWVESDGILMMMENSYRCDLNRLDSRFIFISGSTTEEHNTHHWIFTAGEICRLCDEVGLQVVELLGSLDGERFSVGSDRLLLHAVKRD